MRTTKANIIKAANERVEATLDHNNETYKLVIQKNEERNFDTSCKCDENEHPLCEHKTALFLQLLNALARIILIQSATGIKKKINCLQIMVISLNEDLKGKFEFTYKEGKPFLRVLDTSIKRVAPVASAKTCCCIN